MAGSVTVHHSGPINEYFGHTKVTENILNLMTGNTIKGFLKVKVMFSSSQDVSPSAGWLLILRQSFSGSRITLVFGHNQDLTHALTFPL